MPRRAGLALIIVIGILGVLAVLAAAFVMMAQLERRASAQRVNAARAYLLARSGIEDALARLEIGQDPVYGGEDWDADGTLNGQEGAAEVYRRGTLNTADCPARHAMRPSFFAADSLGTPVLLAVDGRKRGCSGRLAGDDAPLGNSYALKVSPSNTGIYINGGALDAEDRDPDGPGADASAFPLNPGAAAEVAPLLPNHVLDYHDASMAGPNGFLVRLLNNLDAVVTNGATSNLGVQVVEARPRGGYKSLDELKPVLGQARFEQFKPTLTLYAWVDPKVVKPQPMDGRPQRWEDIDDAHRIGTEAKEISGVHADPTPYADLPSPRLTLNPGITGDGTEAQSWTQTITATNGWEGPKTYPVLWERNFIYAWSQLRLGPVAMEPRAPISLNAASPALLASVFLGLKGATLEVWEGSAGWDGGFGWWRGRGGGDYGYPYPSQSTEDTPWHRTRVDYGMTYGHSAFASPSRPWYGPANYDPHTANPNPRPADPNFIFPGTRGGAPVIQCAPLGRLRETPALTQAQAQAGAQQTRQALSDLGPARTWAKVNAFVDRLPRWEDVNEDGILDGAPYSTTTTSTRRIYQREDANGDFILQRETFTPLPGTSWKAGTIAWLDPHLGKAQLPAASAATGLTGSGSLVPGLTFVQKDVLKAMINPNTDLNDFNPDGNLWKEVDKSDLAGIQADPTSYVHTTELSLDDSAGYARIQAVGRVLGTGGRLLALRQVGALARLGALYRDTTQADFMRGFIQGQPLSSLFEAPAAPYSLAGNQPLVSYPEPQTVGGIRGAHAGYDGQISLGFIGADLMATETLRGDLFDTVDATGTGTEAQPDLQGPFQKALLLPAGADTGNVFPGGVYSEKDRSLKFRMQDTVAQGDPFAIACWAKVAWFPEASPRAHALVSTSPSDSWGWGFTPVPVSEIFSRPEGLYFVPARNSRDQDQMNVYNHDPSSTRGINWPCHSLLWGALHTFWASDNLNRRGILELPPGAHPVGRLEAHRWVHLAMRGAYSQGDATLLILGRNQASRWGGSWNRYRFSEDAQYALSPAHMDGTENHLRFGEIASEHSMNYAADATFANVRAAKGGDVHAYDAFSTGPAGPAVLGRHYKENGAAYTSSKLPAGVRPLKATWTEIPCDLWFDLNADGWLGDATVQQRGNLKTGKLPYVNAEVNPDVNVGSVSPLNDQFGSQGGTGPSSSGAGFSGIDTPLVGTLASWQSLNTAVTQPGVLGANGLRDVHIEIEIWDDLGTDDKADDALLARFDDPAAVNRIPRPQGRLTYKAVFVNEWDAPTRANHPLDVTPFLDDVTITYEDAGGPKILAWETGDSGEQP